MSFRIYEPILCSRCKKSITSINEVHVNSKMLPCKSNKKIEKLGFVYLLVDARNERFKIGYSLNPERRLYEFIHHNSTNEITLIGYFPGTTANESVVHSIFKSARIIREWFRNDIEIVQYFTEHPLFKDTSGML